MADNVVWSPKSPNIPNGQIKIANPPEGTSSNNIQNDWTRLNPNSANRAVQNLEYRVNNLNVVEFRYPTTNDPNGPKSTANSIQEIADDSLYVAAYGYSPTTTRLIQDSLRRELTTQADNIGWVSRVAAPAPPQGNPQGGNPQSATQGGAPTQAEGETTTPAETQEPERPTVIGSNELVLGTPLKISSGSGLRYPLRMSDAQDKIKFLAVEITKSADSIDGQPIYTPVDGPIFLSIQSPITDQNSVDWGPDSVNAIEAFLYNKSLEIMKSDNPNEAVKGTFRDIINGFTGNTDRIRKFLAGQAAGLNNVLSRTDSAILNPNLELLFQGPQLRPFTFQFKMTAREPNEAVVIKRIIKYFKYHMAVRREEGLFLRAPHVFTIQYLKGMEPKHPGINLISPEDDKKACALTNCSVDYTPLGTYMTNIDDRDPEKNGTMVAYTLSLQFQEITPIYDTDYKDYANHPIGF